MRNVAAAISKLLCIKSERGVTAVEYGLIASLIALAIIGSLTLIGTNLGTTFNQVAAELG